MPKSSSQAKASGQIVAGKPVRWLDARSLDRLLPPTLPGRASVLLLLTAARVPNHRLVGVAANALLLIIRSNLWLLEFVADEGPYETFKGLQEVPGFGTASQLKDLSFADDFATLIGSPRPLRQLECLRSVYLLARLTSTPQLAADRIEEGAISTLGSAIRRLERKSSGLLGAERMDSVNAATRLEEIGTLAALDFAAHAPKNGKQSQVAQDWSERWLPWIQRISAGMARIEHVASEPDDIPPPSSWSGPDDGGNGEPGVELLPISIPKPSPKGVEPYSSNFLAAFSDQAIRSGNLELSKNHIEVAPDAEIRVVIEHCRRTLELPGRASGLDLGPALLLLQIATGRQHATLADTYILPAQPADGERHLAIDLKKGVLIQPVLVPDQIKKPTPENQSLFDANTGLIELALPTLILSYLKRLQSWRRVDRVVEWLDGFEPEKLITSFLRSIPGLSRASARSSASYRRWLACQLQEIGGDLPKTMLITGDRFGRSNAPLYYTSPKAADLSTLHRSALADFFVLPETAAEIDHRRVGPASVVRLAVAKAGVSQISKRLNINPEKAIADRDKACRYHNALTSYLAHYIAVITSHRPNNALFTLTRRQFDLRRNIAILQDKGTDAEHFTRLVATTDALSESIALYLDHLRALCNRWGTAEAQGISLRASIGELPFLQFFGTDGDLRQGKIDDLKASTAEAWRDLPANWYRPLLSMHLREDDAQALAVLGHVGHLEAASHPFLSESVLAPIEIAEAVRPALVRFEKLLGFRVISGFAAEAAQAAPLPLLDWTAAVRQHEAQLRAIARDQAGLIRANLKPNRRAAADWILDRTEPINPTLRLIFKVIRAERLKTRPRAIDPALKALDVADTDIERLLAMNEEEHHGNDARRVAVHNLLCRWLRSAASIADTKVIDIGLINLSPRAELSPLLRENCVATEQMDVFRSWFEDHLRQGNLLPRQVLRALALILYDGFREPSEVVALSAVREIPPTLFGKGAVLCATVPGRRGPVTLSGLPALSLTVGLPQSGVAETETALGRLLALHLPEHLVPHDPGQTLDYWSSTAQIASRIEKPGLIRFASRPEGVLEASVHQQAAFFERAFPADTVTVADRVVEASSVLDVTAEESSPTSARLPSGLTKALTRRYRRLSTALHSPARVFSDFKQTPPRISSDFEQAKLQTIEAALRLCEPEVEPLAPLDIVSALAGFGRDLCTEGTRKKRVPAVNTVRAYIHDIGRGLLDAFESIDLRTLFDEDFEAAYGLLADMHRKAKSAARASRALADFHEYLVYGHGLPRVETPWLGGQREAEDPRPDPVLLTEAQYLAARQNLFDAVDMSSRHAFEATSWRRLAYASAVILILLRRSGTRISEGTLLRQSEVRKINGDIFLIIRPSLFRQLKSAAATRRINLTRRLDDQEQAFIEVWLRSEKRIHDYGERRSLLFPVLGTPDRPLGVTLLRRVIQEAFRVGAGIEMHPHQLRHLWMTEEVDTAASDSAAQNDLARRVRRFESIRLGIGHTRLRTGAASYIHTRASLCRLSHLLSGAPQPNRWVLAALSGVSVSNVDKLRNRYCADAASLRAQWTDIIFGRAVGVPMAPVRASPLMTKAVGDVRHSPIPVSELDRYIRQLRAGDDSDELCASFGFSREVAHEIKKILLRLGDAPTFYRLLASETRRRKLRQEPLPRDADSSELASIFQRATPDFCEKVESLFPLVYTPSTARLDCFRGSDAQLGELRGVLTALGIPESSFVSESGELKVLRVGKSVGRFHSLCWAMAVMSAYATIRRATAAGIPQC